MLVLAGGGGGGAGGVVEHTNYPLTEKSYAVTVEAGGVYVSSGTFTLRIMTGRGI